MTDSNHFNGSTFKATDDDAAQDERAFNSALEARLTNNAAYLHRYGAGESIRPRVAGSNWTGRDQTEYAGLFSHEIHAQPFLFTKGLNKITVTLCVVLENLDVEVVVAVGPFVSPATTITPWPTHRNIDIVFELPETIDVEYFTMLQVFCNSVGYDASTIPIDYENRIQNFKGFVLTYGTTDIHPREIDQVSLFTTDFEGAANTNFTPFDHAYIGPFDTPSSGLRRNYFNADTAGWSTGDPLVENPVSTAQIARLSLRSVQIYTEHQ